MISSYAGITHFSRVIKLPRTKRSQILRTKKNKYNFKSKEENPSSFLSTGKYPLRIYPNNPWAWCVAHKWLYLCHWLDYTPKNHHLKRSARLWWCVVYSTFESFPIFQYYQPPNIFHIGRHRYCFSKKFKMEINLELCWEMT